MSKLLFILCLFYSLLDVNLVCGQTISNQEITNTETSSSKAQYDELRAQVREIKAAQDTLVSALDGMVSGTQWMFGIALAVISLFYGITTFFQYRREMQEAVDSKDKYDFLMKQNEKYEDYLGRQETKNKELLDSTRDNISQITQLLAALERIFKFREEFENQIQHTKQQDEANKKEIREVNRAAMIICSGLTRYNYRSPENEQRFQDFCNKASKFSDDDLNANSFLIRGLNAALRNGFDSALQDLQKAIHQAKGYASGENEKDELLSQLYPDKRLEEVAVWNRKLANISLYYYAIIQYNLGEYKIAENAFREALEFDNRDIKSILYVPEARFLGHLDDFESIIQEFETIKARIEAITDTRGWGETKDSLLSQLYIRYGNCYFPGCRYEPYRKLASLKKTEEKYELAYGLAKDSYLTKFSYAQVLSLKAAPNIQIPQWEKDRAKKKAEELFREVFNIAKERIGQTNEAKILIMLYYILAICCKEAGIENENPRMFVLEIYKAGANLPANKNLRIFSPLTKNDLTYDELKSEVRTFEHGL